MNALKQALRDIDKLGVDPAFKKRMKMKAISTAVGVGLITADEAKLVKV